MYSAQLQLLRLGCLVKSPKTMIQAKLFRPFSKSFVLVCLWRQSQATSLVYTLAKMDIKIFYKILGIQPNKNRKPF